MVKNRVPINVWKSELKTKEKEKVGYLERTITRAIGGASYLGNLLELSSQFAIAIDETDDH